MGSQQRERCKYLAEKLRAIRIAKRLSQSEMVAVLGVSGIHRGHVARWESGIREPSFPTLLRYARLAKISTDVLIDDDVDLPQEFQS